jgi:signal transduction histidine kinase
VTIGPKQGLGAEEPALRGLWIGILVYRWIGLAWMSTLAATSGSFRSAMLVWLILGITIAWNVWWTLARGWTVPIARWMDLGISFAVLLLSGVVQEQGEVISGDHPFFATAYPVTAAMTFGAAEGPVAGLGAALALSFGLVLSRPLNGVALDELTSGRWTGLGNGVVYYLAAGYAVGLVSRTMRRSADQIHAAELAAAKERERAARFAERESLGRQIHDTVLQALALVTKRGKELARREMVPGVEVGRMAAVAEEQERGLRALIAREPEEAPAGCVPLRTVLQAATYGLAHLSVTVTTVDPAWLDASHVDELTAAVRQALENVATHANASTTSVFGEQDGDEIVVSVRDDGIGFDYDEARLRAEGKLGVLMSMKGRIEGMGGTMALSSTSGKGTLVEFRLPQEFPG